MQSTLAGILAFFVALFGGHHTALSHTAFVASGAAASLSETSRLATAPVPTQPITSALQRPVILYQPVIERIVAGAMPVAITGVTQAQLNAQLQQLDTRYSSQLAAVSASIGSAPTNYISVPAWSPSQRIDNLSNVTITNANLTASEIPTNISTYTSSFTWATSTFAGTTVLSAGTTYGVVLDRTGALYFAEVNNASPPFANDYATYNRTSWVVQSEGIELNMDIWPGAAVSAYVPTTTICVSFFCFLI
jgi:hypothetical protein